MPRYLDMSDDEFADYLAQGQAAIASAAAKIRAEQTTPRSFVSRRRWETIAMLLVTIPERETPLAIWASTDGDDSKAVSIPKSQITVTFTEADGLFRLATMKAWLAIDRHMTQAVQPKLIETVPWTDEQRKAWKLLQTRLRSINDALRPRTRKGSSFQPAPRSFSRSRFNPW